MSNPDTHAAARAMAATCAALASAGIRFRSFAHSPGTLNLPPNAAGWEFVIRFGCDETALLVRDGGGSWLTVLTVDYADGTPSEIAQRITSYVQNAYGPRYVLPAGA